MDKKLICIGGGMGPMSGVELHRLIIENTSTNGIDQDHLEVHHYSRAHDISNRPDFILNNRGENPALGMLRTIEASVAAAQKVNREIVLGIPCATFHAPIIFNSLSALINQHQLAIEVLNMISETNQFVRSNYPEIG